MIAKLNSGRALWYADQLGYAHCPECVDNHPSDPSERQLDTYTVEIGDDCRDCGRYFGTHWGTFRGREMADHVARLASVDLRERENILDLMEQAILLERTYERRIGDSWLIGGFLRDAGA